MASQTSGGPLAAVSCSSGQVALGSCPFWGNRESSPNHREIPCLVVSISVPWPPLGVCVASLGSLAFSPWSGEHLGNPGLSSGLQPRDPVLGGKGLSINSPTTSLGCPYLSLLVSIFPASVNVAVPTVTLSWSLRQEGATGSSTLTFYLATNTTAHSLTHPAQQLKWGQNVMAHRRVDFMCHRQRIRGTQLHPQWQGND